MKSFVFPSVFFGSLSLLVSHPSWGMEEKMAQMPILSAKKVYLVPSSAAGQKLVEQRGFGEKEAKVRMMNLMMVGGSGYEEMDMSLPKDSKKPSHQMDGSIFDRSGHDMDSMNQDHPTLNSDTVKEKVDP